MQEKINPHLLLNLSSDNTFFEVMDYSLFPDFIPDTRQKDSILPERWNSSIITCPARYVKKITKKITEGEKIVDKAERI